MSTSAEQIAALIASNTELKAQFETYFASLEGAKEGFDQLSADLRGVVFSAMNYRCKIDATADLDPRDDGNYHDLASAVSDAPRGSNVTVTLPPNSVLVIDQDVGLSGRKLRIVTEGGAALGAATVLFAPFSNGSFNVVPSVDTTRNGTLLFEDVNVAIGPKANDAQDWANTNRIISRSENGLGPCTLGFKDCTVTAPDGVGLVGGDYGQLNMVTMRNVTLDGPFSVYVNRSTGLCLISKSGVTLLNGADLHTDSGSFVNILQTYGEGHETHGRHGARRPKI